MRSELIDYEPDTQREDEDAREQRWLEFVDWIRTDLYFGADWQYVVGHVHRAMSNVWLVTSPPEATLIIRNFAETEGWHGVLTAIASAMVADDKVRRELVDRR